MDFGTNYFIRRTHPTLLFSTLKRPKKHLIELFRMMVNPFFLKSIKIECHQSRSFFGLTIDVTCLCSGIQGLLCWKSFFSKKSHFRTQSEMEYFEKTFFQQSDSGLFQNKGTWPIFKWKMSDIEGLQFCGISEKIPEPWHEKSLSNPF